MASLECDEPATGRATLRRLRPGWPLYLVLAVLYGIYLGLNHLIELRSNRGLAAWKPFVWECSSVLVIAALIPCIVRLENRFRLDGRPRGRMIAVHAAGALVFSVIHTSSMVGLRKLVYAFAGESYNFGNALVEGFYELQKDAVTYLWILVAAFALREFRARRAGEVRAAALAAELSRAQLQHLTAQIEPHFLFNALNAISNRMHEDVNAADRMISQLGGLLRAAYDTNEQPLVPLAGELEWLRGYAAMMAERFRGQLIFNLEVDPDLETLRVPRLLLQPIVENAFRHGLGEGRGSLCVEVRRMGPKLCYTISDDGVGLPTAAMTRGTGLSNVSRRLELLFADDQRLTVSARAPRGTVVTVQIPVSG
jgi:two-component system, LytTR family, sensor kinase